ncbi:MAG: hypothetical protein H7A33_03580 [Deltaproteobacteria bacterium]|nr:hypothetical protein [Deltaproteobacteria bacterium]
MSSKQVIRLDDREIPHNNLVLTENYSARGVKFTTNAELKSGSFFMIYLNDQIFREAKDLRKSLLRSGDHYLSRVVWTQKIKNDFYQVGAEFLEKKDCSANTLHVFTELMNVAILQNLNDLKNTNNSNKLN